MKLETRHCANPKCPKTFNVLPTSKHAFCSDFCEIQVKGSPFSSNRKLRRLKLKLQTMKALDESKAPKDGCFKCKESVA